MSGQRETTVGSRHQHTQIQCPCAAIMFSQSQTSAADDSNICQAHSMPIAPRADCSTSIYAPYQGRPGCCLGWGQQQITVQLLDLGLHGERCHCPYTAERLAGCHVCAGKLRLCLQGQRGDWLRLFCTKPLQDFRTKCEGLKGSIELLHERWRRSKWSGYLCMSSSCELRLEPCCHYQKRHDSQYEKRHLPAIVEACRCHTKLRGWSANKVGAMRASSDDVKAAS